MFCQKTTMELIFAYDPATAARLENHLGKSQKELVDFYIEVATAQELAPWINGQRTDAERLHALRAFLGPNAPPKLDLTVPGIGLPWISMGAESWQSWKRRTKRRELRSMQRGNVSASALASRPKRNTNV